jgi:CheY-like chemotaxis protein
VTIPELRGNILVIDDERGIRALCGDVLRRAGHQVEVAETAAAGLAAVGRTAFDLVLCDINLPDQDGVSLLPRLLDRDPAPTVILITAYPSIDTAVRGMKLGARDYLGKPFSPDELRLVVGRALAEDALRRDNAALRRQLALGGLLGDSAPMVELRRTIEKVGASDATVLVTGESGTGKELVARALHAASPRSTARSSRSTAARWSARCSTASCSATSAARSPAPITPSAAWSSPPIRARCCSTRSPSCRSSCSPSCCARCRPARSSRSAAPTPSRSTSASWPRPTATCAPRWRPGGSARICSTGSR